MKIIRHHALLFLLGMATWIWVAASPGHDAPHNLAEFGKTGQSLLFMENRGQVLDQYGHARPDILFLGRSGGPDGDRVKVAISSTGISYQFERVLETEGCGTRPGSLGMGAPFEEGLPEPSAVETYRLDMKLLGANLHPALVVEALHPYYENYYNVPSAPEGILGVRAYAKITLENVYPGIDWVIYSQGESMKYDFIVHPGGDPSLIKMKYEGAVGPDSSRVDMDGEGGITLKTPLGEVREHAPVSFCGGERIASRFRMEAGVISFIVGEHDASQELVIDPALVWASYYGGSGSGTENGKSTTVDGSGNVYLGGRTSSTSNISAGGHQNTNAGGSYDAFLVKFDPAGVRVWGTYYGGTGTDVGGDISTDSMGNIFFTGESNSTTNIAVGGHQNSIAGSYDAFLVKFNSAGVRDWGTYYGGSLGDGGLSVATDISGNVYISGHTQSTTNIASSGHQNTFGGSTDGFLAKFSATGVRDWGTYYGGPGVDRGNCVATDATGNVYLAGETGSTVNMASGGYQNTYGGSSFDAFLCKFTSTGVRIWATYYGASGVDAAYSVSTDASGNVSLSGVTSSTNSIAVSTALGGHQDTLSGPSDAFLVLFSPAGTRTWATYYGGTGTESSYSSTMDAGGNIFMSGNTSSLNLVASGGHQNTYGGGVSDAMLVKFNSVGVRQWGTYFGGPGNDFCFSSATDGSGNVYIAGTTEVTGNVLPGGHQNTMLGVSDPYLAKFQGGLNSPPTALCQNISVYANSSCQGTATASLFDNGSTDPDLDPLSFSVSPLGPYPIGNTSVVLSVADGQGNTSICNASITVQDNTPPAVSCTNATVTLDAAGNGTLGSSVVGLGSSDNCGTFTASVSPNAFNCANLGANTVTFTAIDASGNTGSCTAIVTVLDVTPPAVVCTNATVTLDAFGNATIGSSVVGLGTSDNCGTFTPSLTPSSFTCANIGPNTATFTATDASGNSSSCTATITVTDQTTPAITCPANISAFNDAGICSAFLTFAQPVGTDNCTASTTLIAGYGPNANYPVGTLTNTYRVSDGSGNTATCSFTVTVIDNEFPGWTICPSNIVVSTGGSNCPATATWNGPTGYDNCSQGLSITGTHSPGSTFPLGLTTVTYTITDASGNSGALCLFTVMALPMPQPTFTQTGNLLSSVLTWSSYQWLLNGNNIPGANASTYTITQTGTYALSVTDSNGCVNMSDTSLVTGIEKELGSVVLLVFPNPASGIAYVQLVGSDATPSMVRITDLRGRLLFQKDAVDLSSKYEIDLRGMAAGTYVVEILQNGMRRTVRIVLQ